MTDTKEVTLFEKITRVQADISLKKDGKNPFYKSKYITLDNIMDKLQPLLDREWLVVFNMNIPWWVKTIVSDMKDTLTSEFTVEWIVDPQQLWKVITYWRRYNLTSLFNILADEDDDAQSFYEEKKSDRFENAKKNTNYMKQCLDEDDYISKVKAKYKMTKQQETDLRLCYQNAVKSDDALPFN